MTDRVLSEEEILSIESWLIGESINESWTYEMYLKAWKYLRALVASHRLLQQRVTELEGQAEVCSGPCHSPGYKTP